MLQVKEFTDLARSALAIFFGISFTISLCGQNAESREALLSDADREFLTGMVSDVLESSRIHPGQKISPDFGPNATGGVLIRPGGRDCYPSFWIRDYAMSLECGFITPEEQLHMLKLTAATQADQTWISEPGSMIPPGAVADHIRIDDSRPVYFPGTYDYVNQGGERWGFFPPYGDQFFFIHMAWYYVKSTGSAGILSSKINGIRLIDRLGIAFRVPPVRQGGVLVYTTDHFRGVDFGFRDVITITGDLCLTSLLKYRASLQMAELCGLTGETDLAMLYTDLGVRLKQEIPAVFMDNRGMLLASTGSSSQPDVWSTVLAVYFGVLEGVEMVRTCTYLRDAYQKGHLAKKGNIRHVLTIDDFSDNSAWEKSLAPKNTYQNGAWWGTPTGWVCHAISRVDMASARKLAKEYIDNLREGDYRKGEKYGAPWECYNEQSGQNAVYLTTVTCPFIAFMETN